MADTKFPTEVVDLPSTGYFYSEGSSLASGQVEIKYMTAKEEDILTSQNLIRKGVVLDKLLESLIVDKKLNVKEMLIGDKNALFIASRVLAYGKEYTFEYVDSVGNTKKHTQDLTKLKDKKIDFSNHEKGKNLFSFKLPQSERTIEFKLLTDGDEQEVITELTQLSKVGGISKDVTTRLKKMIVSVDDNTDRAYVNGFVDNEFFTLDSQAFRNYYQDITPDINLNIVVVDDEGEEVEITVPMTVQFFWPSVKI
ncbi:MAG: hypothetical protein H8E03_00800 [Pelagibacteraceae bacterium]|nr:hypothetical protein [Pelagibacteraceae bacterium]